MKKRKLFFSGVLLCLLVGTVIAVYWFQKPREGVANAKPTYTLSAKELFEAFQRDEKKANEQFIGKVIEVYGTVESFQKTDSALSILISTGNDMGGVNCSMAKVKDQRVNLTKGSAIRVKGRCIGFLMDVNLVDVVVINHSK